MQLLLTYNISNMYTSKEVTFIANQVIKLSTLT